MDKAPPEPLSRPPPFRHLPERKDSVHELRMKWGESDDDSDEWFDSKTPTQR